MAKSNAKTNRAVVANAAVRQAADGNIPTRRVSEGRTANPTHPSLTRRVMIGKFSSAARLSGQLPEGWTLARLEQLISPLKDKIDPNSCPDTPYLSLEHIESNSNRIESHGLASDVKSTKAVFKEGDVLYGKLRPYLNKVAMPEFDGICSTDILVFRPPNELLPKFLMRFLSQPDLVQFATDHSKGNSLPRVSFKDLANYPLPLPPLAEQKRIVAKVEALLERVGKARERLARVPDLLRRFRQSVLAAACSGQLTADWRGENADITSAKHRWKLSEMLAVECEEFCSLPSSWVCRRLTDISDRVSVGHVGPTSKYYCDKKDGVPFLRSQNVRPGRLDLKGLQYITHQFHDSLKKSQLQQGDLLVVRVGANRGDVCFVQKSFKLLNCANIVFARPFKGITEYLNLYCQSSVGQDLLLSMTTGSAQGVINTKSVALLPIPIPPIAEQQEIVRRVNAQFEIATKIEQRISTGTNRTEKITQSILAKAFAGELVETEAALAHREARDYEPASVLLERIAAERVGVDEKNKKAKKPVKKKSAKRKKAKVK